MRDLIVAALVLGSIPFILRQPYLGILVWSWIGYMNPHRMAYGFAQSMPFAQIIALVTVAAMLFSKEPKRVPVNGLTAIWAVYLLWMVLAAQLAIYPSEANTYLVSVLKIQFVTILTMVLISDRMRMERLLWVIVLSIGFFSVKGGLFTLATGGSSRVYGPPGGMIEENNALALATLMIIPIMAYLHRQATRRWVRWMLTIMILLSAVAVFGSQSRGAIVGGSMLALFFWFKSHRKFLTAVALVVLIPLIVIFMPDSWHERIGTMTAQGPADAGDIAAMRSRDGTERLSPPIPSRDRLGYWPNDFSALGRVNAWNYAINVANSRITGAGFQSWTPDMFERFAPIVEEVQGGHSIFFSVLADSGWPGLLMWLSILALSWRYASWTRKAAQAVPDQRWIAELMPMLQLSLVAYAVTGAFLSLAYFDLPWHIISLIVLCREFVRRTATPPRRFGEQYATGAQLPNRLPAA